jgi:hypothetical protein
MNALPLPRRLLLIASFAVPGAAQNVLFAENFDAGIPAAWSNRHLGPQMDPWYPGTSPATGSPDVYHEFFCMHGGVFRNNMLVSPRIDLTGFTRADFSCAQIQVLPLQRVSNRVEVSTDGGNTFALLYEETGTWIGPGTIQANLDAYAGLPDVRVAFHYQGAFANEWRIDDVRVTTPQPVLEIGGLTAGGTATFSFGGGTPGALVVMAISLTGTGPVPTPFGSVHLSPPIGVLPLQIAGPGGGASAALAIPAWAAGIVVHAHAGELLPGGGANLSNRRTATVQ